MNLKNWGEKRVSDRNYSVRKQKYGIGRVGFMPLLQGIEVKYGIERIGSIPLLQGSEAKYGIERIGFMPLLQGVEAK